MNSNRDGSGAADPTAENLKNVVDFIVGETQRNYEYKIRQEASSSARSRLLVIVSVGIILRFAFSLSLSSGAIVSETYKFYAGYLWPNALVESVWVMFTMLTTIGYGQEVPIDIANSIENTSGLGDIDTSLDETFEIVSVIFLIVYILVGLSIVGNVIEVLRAELISDRNTFRENRRSVALNNILLKLRHAAVANSQFSVNDGAALDNVSETVRAIFSRIDIGNEGRISLRQ